MAAKRGHFLLERHMIKMKSHHPLLVNGEARTEFETDEQHARELELAGLALRVEFVQPPIEQPAAVEERAATPEVDSEKPPEAAPAAAVAAPAKVKKAK
jgi:hypothetical protein